MNNQLWKSRTQINKFCQDLASILAAVGLFWDLLTVWKTYHRLKLFFQSKQKKWFSILISQQHTNTECVFSQLCEDNRCYIYSCVRMSSKAMRCSFSMSRKKKNTLPCNHSREDVITVQILYMHRTEHTPRLWAMRLTIQLAPNLGSLSLVLYRLSDKNATAPGARWQVPRPRPDKTDETALSFFRRAEHGFFFLFPVRHTVGLDSDSRGIRRTWGWWQHKEKHIYMNIKRSVWGVYLLMKDAAMVTLISSCVDTVTPLKRMLECVAFGGTFIKRSQKKTWNCILMCCYCCFSAALLVRFQQKVLMSKSTFTSNFVM